MPYTRAWDETQPPGTALAATLDTIIQNFKTDTRERVAGIFGLNLAQFSADPIVPISLTLSGALVAASLAGPLTGNVTGNLTGSVLTASQTNITSLGTLTGLAVSSASGQPVTVNSSLAGGAFRIDVTFQRGNVDRYHLGVNPADEGAIINAANSAANVSWTDLGVFTFRSTVIAPSLTGTLNTAAQPNITSIGTQLFTITSNAALIVNGTGLGINSQYMRITNTGGDTIWGTENNAGGSLFAGTGAYASVFGAAGARSVQFITNNAVRQTIDSTGNVVFTGTVTAANFVGPTSIDANNLTGTNLAANVVTSSLTTLGVITGLTVASSILIGTASVSGYYFSTNATRRWELTAAGDLVPFANNTYNIGSASFTAAGIWATTFTGNLVGNLTGTILTAAQANITSVGTLTGLTSSSNITVTGGAFVQGSMFVVASSGLTFGAKTGSVYDFTVINAANTVNVIRIPTGTSDVEFAGRGLFGTTSVVGVAAGGIHAAGASVFDSSLSAGATTLTALDVVAGRISSKTVAEQYGIQFRRSDSGAGVGMYIGSSAHATNPDMIFSNNAGTEKARLKDNGDWTIVGAMAGITTLTATTINGTLATASQTNITAVGTLGSLAVTGTVTAGGFSGNLTGTILTAAQANITSVGSLTSLTTGNITMSASVSRILSGATSFAIRNAANSLDWLLMDGTTATFNNIVKATQYQDGAGNLLLQVRKAGWGVPSGTAQRGTFATDTVTLINLARGVKALIDDLTSYHGLLGP